MNNWDYVREVSALHAPERLRRKIAALPAGGRTRAHNVRPYRRWAALAAALVLVVGLGVAAPSILRAMAPPGGEVDPPVASASDPEGIVAEGIDVSPVILDAAKEYVGEQYNYCVAELSNPQGAAVYDNWRINALSAVYERKELGDYTVAVYELDYRVHTTTPEFVPLPGGMEMDENGWVLLSHPDSTYLVFILNYSTVHYFGARINEFNPGSELFDETLAMDINAYIAGLGEDTADTDPWGITLRVEDVTPTGLTLVIEQSGGTGVKELTTGREFWIERYEGGQWRKAETLPGVKNAWTLEGLGIPMDDARQLSEDWDWLYGALPDGEYRIGKGIINSRAPGDYDEKVYYAEFTVNTAPPQDAHDRIGQVRIENVPFDVPFSTLDKEIRATLEDTGVVEDWSVLWPERASPWLMKTYHSPSLEVQTLMVPTEILEQLLADGTFTQEQYDAALNTEYVYTARPLDSSYPTGSGLRLGDSAERARALFYDVPDDGEKSFNAGLAVLTVITENGVVTGLLSSSGGRTVAGILY